MQLTIFVAADLVQTLRFLAIQDCRSLHQEAKWLLTQAIQEAARRRQGVEDIDTQETTYASASQY